MLSIIIVNYNQKDWLKQALTSLEAARIRVPFEIIVVDNASTDNSGRVIEEFKEKFPNLVLIENSENLGFAKAINQGIKKAKGEYFFLSNPDVLITPDSLETMQDFLSQRPEIGLLGPRLTNLAGETQPSCFSFPRWYTPFVRRTFLGRLPFGKKELRRYLMKSFDHQTIQPVGWLQGAALMTSRLAIEKNGLMDERFFLYFEDIDWCQRFKKNGLAVLYFPLVSMFHYHQRLSAQNKGFSALFDKFFWQHIISAIKYFWKWRKK